MSEQFYDETPFINIIPMISIFKLLKQVLSEINEFEIKTIRRALNTINLIYFMSLMTDSIQAWNNIFFP